MRRLLWLAVAALGVAGTASAQSEADRADGRCFLSLQMLKAVAQKEGQLKPEDEVTIDKMGAFFIGRIRGRNPAATPLGSIITPEIARAAASNFVKDTQPCFKEAAQYGADFKATLPIIREATQQMNEESAKLDAESEKIEAEIAKRKGGN